MGGSEGARDEGGEMHLASPFSPRESRGGEGQLKEKVPTHLHLPEKKKNKVGWRTAADNKSRYTSCADIGGQGKKRKVSFSLYGKQKQKEDPFPRISFFRGIDGWLTLADCWWGDFWLCCSLSCCCCCCLFLLPTSVVA